MEIPKKNKSIVMTDEIKEEQWELMPYGASQYWIIHKNNGKTTFIATVEDSRDDERNKIIALVLSKAPQLLQIIEALYSGAKGTTLEKTIMYYMIKKLLNEIKDYEHTGSVRNT